MEKETVLNNLHKAHRRQHFTHVHVLVSQFNSINTPASKLSFQPHTVTMGLQTGGVMGYEEGGQAKQILLPPFFLFLNQCLGLAFQRHLFPAPPFHPLKEKNCKNSHLTDQPLRVTPNPILTSSIEMEE
ncbi:hypothetical protein CEXT_76041 [Caerostris extrusa]|uniref:Uncharacterized protein n=1 Tax=Caerostris extrusa TaxID=172846 RepID=A0AAV4TCB2_CAEEX|nr:hypothetical protein CEXT_76041 [Caerostris extrusa]